MPGRFTFFSESIHQNVAEFSEGEFNHIVKVTRYSLGDLIEFTDGKGQLYTGKLIQINKRNCYVEIFETIVQEPPKLIIAMGILKNSDRMEWAVEKCTELGASVLFFLHTKNSERSKINVERLNKTAISAIKQSHTSYLPRISDLNFKEFIIQVSQDEYQHLNKYIAFCDIDSLGDDFVINNQVIPIKNLISTTKELRNDDLITIGPEGDFSPEEVKLALSNGFRLLDLGKRILRSETAVVSTCAIANYNI